MGYRLVADAAMVAHFAFLAYLTVGGFVAWRWPRSIWAHVGVALYGLANVVVGWPCPLTHVENWGRARAGQETLPATGFIDAYLTDVVYPGEHERLAQVLVALVVLVSWAGFLLHRRRADGVLWRDRSSAGEDGRSPPPTPDPHPQEPR
jgi:hypothetical protein